MEGKNVLLYHLTTNSEPAFCFLAAYTILAIKYRLFPGYLPLLAVDLAAKVRFYGQ
jgi:hypothetical protein